jgi:hypothetical protein
VNGCPCLHTTPCHPRCTCVQPYSSHGCARCCRYGSAEQRRERAEALAALPGEVERLRRLNESLAERAAASAAVLARKANGELTEEIAQLRAALVLCREALRHDVLPGPTRAVLLATIKDALGS